MINKSEIKCSHFSTRILTEGSYSEEYNSSITAYLYNNSSGCG